MKLSRLVCRNVGLSWLALAALVNSAIAGTPGQQCDATQGCDQKCGSPGSSGVPCWIKVTQAGGKATVEVQNLASADPVCIVKGTDVYWYTSEDKSEFTVIFGTPHPFHNTSAGAQPIFKGKKGQASGDTTKLPQHIGDPACFQYSVQHCIEDKCTQADPKVIISSVLIEKKQHRPPKEADKK